jgi:dolichyl-phosphate beta-glucosyltransferase
LEKPKISIVIPVFNAAVALEANLPVLLNWLRQVGLTFECIVVDDGSDRQAETRVVAERAGVQFLALSQNRGKGAAVREGMRHCRGEFHFFTDADIPFEPEVFNRMLSALEEGFDLCIGDRGLAESVYFEDVSSVRRWGSRLYTWMVTRFITGGISDTQCGLKGFRAAVARDLFENSRINGFALDVELIFLALHRKYRINRVWVKLRSTDGNSVRVWKHGWVMLVDLMKIRFLS